MKTNHLFVLICSLYITVAFSQNSLRGTIINQNKVPLEGAHVHIGEKTFSTKKEGTYLANRLKKGPTKIFVSFVGHIAIDTTITIAGNQVLNFILKENTMALQEVLIDQKPNTQNRSVLEQKLKTTTIERFGNESLGDALKEVAGVSSLKTGSTVVKPIINGLFGSRVPIINNNVRMQDQEWGTEHAPNFDINAAGKITVIKGASGLQYGGDAIGGLVIIEPVLVRKDTLFGKTLINGASNGRGGSISSSLHRGNGLGWSWNTVGTFKYMGDRQAPDYILSNTGNREANFTGDIRFAQKNYNFSAMYSYYSANIGILAASHSGSITDLYNSINNSQPSVIRDFTYSIGNPKQNVQHHLAKLNYLYHFDETASIAAQYSFQYNKRLEFDVRRGNLNNIAALDLELSTHNFGVDYKKSWHDWNFKSGANAVYQNNFANPATGIRPLIPNYDRFDFGTYAVASLNYTSDLVLDAGFRYDYSAIDASKFYQKSRWIERGYDVLFPEFVVKEVGNQILTEPSFAYHNVSASLGFHKTFAEHLDWYFNTSLASRNPNPSELFSDGLHHSNGIIELGDLALSKEQSFKISTTLAKQWNAFSIDINPYINYINNYMFLSPTGVEMTIRGAFPVWEYEQTNARLTGIDIQSLWKISPNWQLKSAFSYIDGDDLSNNEPLIDMPPMQFINTIQYSKKEWHELLLELKADVVFTQKSFPDNNFMITILDDANNPSEVLLDISTPPPGYQLLNFYSEMAFNTFHKTKTTVAFSVQNLLNTSYRDYLNRQRFFADEIGRNFQIQIKFNY